jgi:hypothetical protein
VRSTIRDADSPARAGELATKATAVIAAIQVRAIA